MAGIVITEGLYSVGDVKRGPDGRLWTAYSKEIDVDGVKSQNLFISYSDNGIVWVEEQLTNSKDYSFGRGPTDIRLVIDTLNNIHLFWREFISYRNYKIQYKKRVTQGWQDKQLVEDSTLTQESICIYIDRGDNIHLIWNEYYYDESREFPDSYTVKYKKYISGQWQDSEVIITSPSDRMYMVYDIVVDSDENVHCVGSQFYDYDQYYSNAIYLKRNNGGWQPPIDLAGKFNSNITYNSYSICIDSNNNLYASIESNDNVYMIECISGLWGELKPLGIKELDNQSAILTVDNSDNVNAIIIVFNNGYELWHKKKTIQGWSKEFKISKSYDLEVAICLRESSIIWNDNDNRGTLMYTHFPFTDGQGTADNPFVITGVDQLQAIDFWLDRHFILGNDIDASDTINWNNGEGFRPIGAREPYFCGSLDGKGFIIKRLYINRPSTNYVGLISAAMNDTYIVNVGLVDANIIGDTYVGSLIGWGNLITVLNCYSSGYVLGDSQVGGLIGAFQDIKALVKYCYSKCCVTAQNDGDACGGLIGALYRGSCENSFAIGDVSGSYGVGGLIGYSEGSADPLSFCLINNCYCLGKVSGNSSTGGLLGKRSKNHNIINSYYNFETSGQSDVEKGIPLTTVQMKDKSSYIGWDFKNTWEMFDDYNNGYPYLINFKFESPLLVFNDIQDLQDGQTYYYRIRKGMDFRVSDWSNEVSITYVKVELFTGYVIQRKTLNGEWVEIGRVPVENFKNSDPISIQVIEQENNMIIQRVR